MKNIVIRMVNGDEYHLHDTKITILRTRNFDDMNFIEIDSFCLYFNGFIDL